MQSLEQSGQSLHLEMQQLCSEGARRWCAKCLVYGVSMAEHEQLIPVGGKTCTRSASRWRHREFIQYEHSVMSAVEMKAVMATAT